MFEHFTDRARKVMALANQEAQRFNQDCIGTEHILLGIVKEASGVGANVIKNFGVELRRVRLEVEKLLKARTEVETTHKLDFTPRAKHVLECAVDEARRLNHNYVGTEHLLLGLLREEDGVAAQVLRNLGLKLDDVRDEILALLGGGVDAEAPEKPDALTLPSGLTGRVAEGVARCFAEIDSIRKTLEEIHRKMDEAVQVADYERAAALRERALAIERRLNDSESAAVALQSLADWIAEIRREIERGDQT